MPQIGRMGFLRDRKGNEAFAASLPYRLNRAQLATAEQDDDNGDRFQYRATVRLLRDAGQAKWLERDDAGRWRLVSRNQGNHGSCVGHGTAIGIETTAHVDIVEKHQDEQFMYMTAPDALYGMGRQIVGQLGGWQGSNGSWAAKAVNEWGTPYQRIYGSHDLTHYSTSRCSQYIRSGVPKEIIEASKPYLVRTIARLTTGQEIWNAIGAGGGVNLCSSIGWNANRDGEGIIRIRGSWNHSMGISSRRTTKGGNRLLLIHQSWGDNWTGGGYYLDQPLGSFWATIEDVDRAARQGDTYGYFSHDGIRISAEQIGGKIEWLNDPQYR